MDSHWAQISASVVFLGALVALRIWAARKYGKVPERIEIGAFREAYDALCSSSDATFTFLVMAIVSTMNRAWPHQ